MILVPQRLFSSPHVRTLARRENHCILHKAMPESLEGREAYVANHVVSLVLKGRQRIETYEEDLVGAGPGEVLFLPRGLYYVTDLISGPRGTFESLLFYFDDDAIQRFLADVSVTEVDRDAAPEYLKFRASPVLRQFVASTLALAENGQLTGALLKIKTNELLHLLHGLSESKAFAEFLFRLTLPRRRNLGQFMEHNFRKPLGVEDFAYLTGRSVSSFRRDFRSHYATTPNKWLRQRRMRAAAAALDVAEMSVADLSLSVGYENVSYFIREFRNVNGLSPKQYMLARRGMAPPPADA